MPESNNAYILDDSSSEVRRQEALFKTGALQNAILTSANFSIIATDEKGIIQLFNVGAERLLGYTAAEVVNEISPSDMHDPQEVMARAQALSRELATPIAPGFEALAFKASRGIEDVYELTKIRKDGSRFPAIVSITALRDDYGEIIGYGLSGDAHHITAPAEDGDGALRCMKAAIARAGISAAEIDYINAHGTSTPLGDEIELGAVQRLVGNDAAHISMSSTKSSVGHLLGAAGAVEAIFSILAMRDGVAPPTINLDNPSVETAIDLVPHRAKKRKIDIALSNSFGFGGTNASLVFRRLNG